MPSSKSLARAMADQLSIGPDEYVVELGPGTGVVTNALLQVGLDARQLIVIERDARFLTELKHRFPHTLIVQGDARHLDELLHRHGIQQVAAVVSSLPLLSMPDRLRHAIVGTAFKVIKPQGVFIQFTYGFLSPVSSEHQRKIGIKGCVTKQVWRNFPPARIWRYTAQA